MKKVVKHIRRWSIWRKRNRNSRFYKFCVLIGLTKSPTMILTYLPEEWGKCDSFKSFRK